MDEILLNSSLGKRTRTARTASKSKSPKDVQSPRKRSTSAKTSENIDVSKPIKRKKAASPPPIPQKSEKLKSPMTKTSNQKPVAKPAPPAAMSNFRIPKVKSPAFPSQAKEDSTKRLLRTSPRSRKDDEPPQKRKLAGYSNEAHGFQSSTKDDQVAGMHNLKKPRQTSKLDTSHTCRKPLNKVVPKPDSPTGRSKRKEIEAKIPLSSKITPIAQIDKLKQKLNNSTSAAIATTAVPIPLNSYSLPLPDYEDENMDWENPVPEIRRLWDETADLPNSTNTDDDMEVDPTEMLILVPDSNIWIGCINLLKQLLNTDFPTVGYPSVVIPWMVLQELDVRTKSSGPQQPSRYAVRFIHDLLTSKHPRVRGQKASDAVLSQMKFGDINADDSILQCAFQLQRTDTTVVFLSNDRNLSCKALVHGLITFDSQDAVSKITKIFTRQEQSLSSNANQSTFNNSASLINTSFPKYNTPLNPQLDSFSKQNTSNPTNMTNPAFFGNRPTALISPCQPSISTSFSENKGNFPTNTGQGAIIFAEVAESLKNAITYVIETKMNEDYGECWARMVRIKPPWSLLSGVKCMILHWIAVFSFVFGRRGQISAEELLKSVQAYQKSSGDKNLEICIVENAIGLFNLGKSSDLVRAPQVTTCIQQLMNFVASNKS